MELLALSVYLSLLAILILFDMRSGLLPDRFTLLLLWCGLLYHVVHDPEFLVCAVTGAAAGYTTLWSIYWLWRLARHKEALGYGDFKLLAALGAWHGWQALPAIVAVAALLGLLVASLRYLHHLPYPASTPLCFGPMLAAGGIVIGWGPVLMTVL